MYKYFFFTNIWTFLEHWDLIFHQSDCISWMYFLYYVFIRLSVMKSAELAGEAKCYRNSVLHPFFLGGWTTPSTENREKRCYISPTNPKPGCIAVLSPLWEVTFSFQIERNCVIHLQLGLLQSAGLVFRSQ